MGLKRKQALGGSNKFDFNSNNRANTAQANTKSKIVSTPSIDNSNSYEDNNDDDAGYVSGNSQSQASSILLNRKNRLNHILSSSQVMQESNNQSPKVGSRFEEDEGFVYKRNTEPRDTKHKPLSSSLKRLKGELLDLNNDQEIEILDLEEPPKKKTKEKAPQKPTGRKRGRPPKNPDQKKNGTTNVKKPKTTKNKTDHAPLLADNDYEEHVSHHKLGLTDSYDLPKTSRKPDSTSIGRKRRPSYYNRGKRVSSIGNGFVGEPHEDVPIKDYYKILDASMPEPHRMRQLLIWCFKKRLDIEGRQTKSNSGNETTEDQTVINIAKVIKEEMLQDLISGRISTSWYDRESKEESDQRMLVGKEITLPNPLNISNKNNIELFKDKLTELQEEKRQWQNSFEKTIKPIENILVNPVLDPKQVENYCENIPERTGWNESVLNESHLNKIANIYDMVKTSVKEDLESPIDKLFDISYRLSRAHELIGALHENKFNEKISQLTNNYMTRGSLSKLKSSNISNWPLPDRQISTKELLRGMTRLEHPSPEENY
ncbi:Piso0_004800 [Millerozyma farinosa CBS 7064]|uniref:Piso0_004800 protein n=1 Tax=Pichia sorbitophila (strain ATCC MYA-4447 / BCRC 22081 / CBS 7064 / NBRC 10061 / NRRL Y-12695) TaxID=559304 RepID=G8Y3F0_PICSO|nr:Piso0_004800 [Millerozyma farinosa CBS 7064]